MYPVKLGYDEAIKRIRTLIQSGHHAEALLTSIFTVEKTLRRMLKQLMVSAGFRSTDANTLCESLRGIEAIKANWPVFDPSHRSLPSMIPNKQWARIAEGIKMRNKLVHGARVFDLAKCKDQAEAVLDGLDALRTEFKNTYGYDGWDRVAVRRKSQLHTDPKVNT